MGISGIAIFLFSGEPFMNTSLPLDQIARRHHLIARLALDALSESTPSTQIQHALTALVEELNLELISMVELLPDCTTRVQRVGPGWHCSQVNQILHQEYPGPLLDLVAPLDEAITVENLAEDHRFEAPGSLLASQAVSGICSRMYLKEQVFGAVLGFCTYSRTFTETEKECFSQVATILASIIERTRLEHFQRDRERKLLLFNEVLLHVSKLTVRRLDEVTRILRTITEAASHSLETERVSIWVYSDDRSQIECLDLYESSQARHSHAPVISAKEFPRYFRALEEERIIAAHDARQASPIQEFSEVYLAHHGIGALLDAPIRLSGEMVGVVCHEHVGGTRHWTFEEQNFAASIADAVSLVLEAAAAKRAEAALQESETRYRELFENAHDLVYIHDLEGNFIDINRTMERLTGYRREEIRQMNVDVILVEPEEDLTQPSRAPMNSADWLNYEIEMMTKHGQRIPLEINTRLIVKNGVPCAVQGIARNISERKRSERKRVESLQRLLESIRVINSNLALNTVLQSIVEEGARLVKGDPGAISLVEGDAIHHKWVWHQGHWEDGMLSFRLGEGVIGHVAQTGLTEVVNDPRYHHRATVKELAEKQYVHGWMDVPIIARSGEVVGVLDVRRRPGRRPFHDVDRKLIESLADQAAVAIEKAALYSSLEQKTTVITASMQELERLYENAQEVTKRLNELDQMKTNFIVVMSHELRTPLTILKGYTDTLVDGYFGELQPDQRDCLVAMQRMVERLETSMSDIIEMLRINEKQIVLNPVHFDLAEVIRRPLTCSRFFPNNATCITRLNFHTTVWLRGTSTKSNWF